MNKDHRYALIAAAAKKSLAVRSIVVPSIHDVREEVKLAKAHDDDNSIVDIEETAPGVSSEMASVVESFKDNVKESDYVLSAKERKDLKGYRGLVLREVHATQDE